ncbi:hypothetical protein BJ322DRAFT_1112371 [Thelephora terrestris]|uniref:Uncharacterized protein n=1 Tax=Thelephora terrestris TaxID=56493 RepID=A0A9P6L3U6_9AGAM|nr:hypothetical protein BJ322DRAFT_1112371 [Thelephora terrestris]
MSGNWAWEQCDQIATDATTHGSMFIPIILGSDKTTVSVATGQHSYHPVYLSVGKVHNRLQQAHRAALVLISFLPIPKGTCDDAKSKIFRDFCHCLFHGCLAVVNGSTKPYMATWDVVCCADYHFRRAIYGIGPHIADYPEQLLAAGVMCDADHTDLNGSPAVLCTLRQLLRLSNSQNEDTLWYGYVSGTWYF